MGWKIWMFWAFLVRRWRHSQILMLQSYLKFDSSIPVGVILKNYKHTVDPLEGPQVQSQKLPTSMNGFSCLENPQIFKSEVFIELNRRCLSRAAIRPRPSSNFCLHRLQTWTKNSKIIQYTESHLRKEIIKIKIQCYQYPGKFYSVF